MEILQERLQTLVHCRPVIQAAMSVQAGLVYRDYQAQEQEYHQSSETLVKMGWW